MRFAVLGSGSGGNSTVVECDGRYLLVDAGLSAKQLILRLECLGLSPENLAGILLTHEHGDHIRGLDVFLRNFRVPLVASIMTGRVVQESLREPAQWVAFESGQQFHWEGFDLTTFAISHDAVEPVGYVIGRGDCRVGVATDLGYADAKVIQALQGVEGLVLEANYDWQMLEADLKRPFSTKQRISSRHGHLSNEQAAELVAELVPAGLKRVVLGHLSSDCNCPLKAVEVVRERTGRGNLEICAASQNEVTEWQSIVPELPLLSASCVPPASAFPDCSAKIKQHQAAPVPSVIEERADCRNPAVIGPLPYESGIRPRVDLVRGVEAHLFSGIIVGHDLNVELPWELVARNLLLAIVATAGLTALTGGAGAGLAIGGASAKRGIAKTLQKAVLREALDQTENVAIRGSMTATGAQARQTAPAAMKGFAEHFSAIVGHKATMASSLFIPVATRSGSMTYAAVYDALERTPEGKNLTPEERHDKALAAGATAGMVTGIITTAFSIKSGVLADYVLEGATGRNVRAVLNKLAGRELSDKVYSAVLKSFLADGAKQFFRRAAGKQIVKGFTDEAMEEGLDEYLNSIIQASFTKEELPFEQVARSTMMGALYGGIFGAGC